MSDYFSTVEEAMHAPMEPKVPCRFMETRPCIWPADLNRLATSECGDECTRFPDENDDYMEVRRENGRVYPELNQAWSELKKLRWNAAVMTYDTGVPVLVHPIDGMYSVQIGRSSHQAEPFHAAWFYISAASAGAEQGRRVALETEAKWLEIAHRNSANHGYSEAARKGWAMAAGWVKRHSESDRPLEITSE